MPDQTNFPLPVNLPRPVDDGGGNHLKGMAMPLVSLPSTTGRMVDLSGLNSPRTVIYCYPMTGVPGKALPEGWDMIPGARGCTPQTCGFRDHYEELSQLKANVYGGRGATIAIEVLDAMVRYSTRPGVRTNAPL